jgi:hypothetical protein
MTTIERFMSYAADFEKTFADDDWSRLAVHFSEGAVYEVRNASFACRVEGRERIFEAIRRSLDGFDRRCENRQIALTHGPVVYGPMVELDWKVSYSKAGAPDFVLVGGSVARVEGDRIVHMIDRYPDGASDSAAAWIEEYAPEIDPSYV